MSVRNADVTVSLFQPSSSVSSSIVAPFASASAMRCRLLPAFVALTSSGLPGSTITRSGSSRGLRVLGFCASNIATRSALAIFLSAEAVSGFASRSLRAGLVSLLRSVMSVTPLMCSRNVPGITELSDLFPALLNRRLRRLLLFV